MAKTKSIVWHRLAIRTPKGAEWEPACQFIISPALALRTAILLREYLTGNPEAQNGVPQGAVDIKVAIAEDGEEPKRCAVEIHRGQPDKWRKMMELPAEAKKKSARRPRRRDA